MMDHKALAAFRRTWTYVKGSISSILRGNGIDASESEIALRKPFM